VLNNLKIGQRLALGFGLVLTLLLAVGATALVAGHQLAEAERWNQHTYRVKQAGDGLLKSMINMETGARGFGIANDEKFLEPWKLGLVQFEKNWQEARQLTADNPEQQRRLDDMQRHHAAFREVVESMIVLRKQVGDGSKTMEEFAAYFGQGKDKAAMDAFRLAAAEFDRVEVSLLEERSATAAELRALNVTVIVAMTGLALGLGLFMAWTINRSVTGPITRAAEAARAVAAGDLTRDVASSSRDETGDLLRSLGDMTTSLRRIVGQVRAASDSIATGSSQIATGNADLSQRTEEQASNLQQTAASMEQLAGNVKNNSDYAVQASRMANEAAAVAERGGAVVGEVVGTMHEIAAASSKIADIISVIDGIAFQTNILALNAAVEAARAGEQGRGFAVVASEVRSLAQRSADAAKEIKNLIGSSVEKVEAGTQQVDRARSSMDEIVTQVQRVTQLIGEISAASQAQNSGIQQVGGAVQQLDQVTQQNAALVEESAAAADSLRAQAQRLAEVVAAFKLGQEGDPAAPQAAAPAPAPGRAASTPADVSSRLLQRTQQSARQAARPAASTGASTPTAPAAPPLAATKASDQAWEAF
jgi:methyl-accepting chemotaxis protein